jgi:hypothetical protein
MAKRPGGEAKAARGEEATARGDGEGREATAKKRP